MSISDADLESLLYSVHAAPPLGVLLFAGAGAQALTWLHSVGGSSRTVLEATDHYAAASLVEAVGFEPARYTSERVAAALAGRAQARAQHLAPDAPTFGLGCTASIATDRAKRGEHRAFVAVRDPLGTSVYGLELTKGARTRREEEACVSWLMLRAVAEACGVFALPELDVAFEYHFSPVDALQRLQADEVAWVRLEPTGVLHTDQTLSRLALLSGSFNPLHAGHRKLARAAAQHLGRPAQFELPLINADKAPIDLAEARRRAAQFAGYAPVVFTRAPLFQQKADLFPESVFVVGVDTALRLVEPRFYGGAEAMDAALGKIGGTGCRFLVAGREDQSGRGQRFLTLEDVNVPPAHHALFEALPEQAFRQDIASSALRREAAREGLM